MQKLAAVAALALLPVVATAQTTQPGTMPATMPSASAPVSMYYRAPCVDELQEMIAMYTRMVAPDAVICVSSDSLFIVLRRD